MLVPDELVAVKASVNISGFYGYLYTSKLVKTILIKAYPPLAEHFKPASGSTPKLIHISPLYATTPRGVRCLYSYASCRDREMAKCNGPPRNIKLNSTYHFYLGLHESTASSSEVVSALINYKECFEFVKQKVCVETLAIDVSNPRIQGREVARRVLENRGVKIVFSSPTHLRDPLKTSRKHKTMLPTPLNVFATPIRLKLYTTGMLRKGLFRKQLLRIHRLFNETYSVLNTARVRWVYYTDKPIPALTGYVNYRVDEKYLEHLEKQGVNVEEWLAEIFAYLIALGTGAGRATGFGHVEVKPVQAESREE